MHKKIAVVQLQSHMTCLFHYHLKQKHVQVFNLNNKKTKTAKL